MTDKNQLWKQIQGKFANIFTFKQLFYFLSLGGIFSWFTKSELTPIFFSGKTFAGRSELIQIAIVIFLIALYTILIVCVFYAAHLLFPSYLDVALSKLVTLRHEILELPILYWVFGSFLAAYYLFFISPVFLNPEHSMKFGPYLDVITPIGGDLRLFLSMGRAFANQGDFANAYPPLVTLLMTPFASIDPASVYQTFSAIIFLSYLCITFAIPALIVKKEQGLLLIVAICLTGLFSYGFHSELERGQLNVIAFQFVLIAVYLFHYKPKFRYLAYVLFSIGVHIKIYPVIYILMFVDNWKEWKINFKRFAGIGILNLVFLFVLGYEPVNTFYRGISKITTLTSYVWMGDHSIKSFVMLLQAGQFQRAFSNYQLLAIHSWAVENADKIGNALTILALLCFLLVVFRSFQQNVKGFVSDIFIISTLVALLVPAISHDYTLSILGSAIGISLGNRIDLEPNSRFRLLYIFLISLISFAYSSVLFSYTNKPLLLQNNLPALMVMLFSFTIMTFLPQPTPDSKILLDT
jgi:hypothetical protein